MHLKPPRRLCVLLQLKINGLHCEVDLDGGQEHGHNGHQQPHDGQHLDHQNRVPHSQVALITPERHEDVGLDALRVVLDAAQAVLEDRELGLGVVRDALGGRLWEKSNASGMP